MPRPAIIDALEEQSGFQFRETPAPDAATFMRYGRAEDDRARYWLDKEGHLVGLCLRSSTIDQLELDEETTEYLRALLICENELKELVLPALPQLSYLDISDSPNLRELQFSRALPRLQYLDLSDSALENLHLPTDFAELNWLDASRCQLKSCRLEGEFPQLLHLDLSGNQALQRFQLSAEMPGLRRLYLNNGGLKKLDLNAQQLPALEELHLQSNSLKRLPEKVILGCPLQLLRASGNHPRNMPSTFLEEENCLPKAQIWFTELAKGNNEPNRDIKLMVMGNGNVGKSTLLCALQSEDEQCECNPTHDSTQGVVVGRWPLDKVTFHYWDFGGQEIYYSTHELFMRDEGVQMIVYDTETEQKARDQVWEPDRNSDEDIINFPFQYWWTTARERSSYSQWIVVQNKAEPFPERDQPIRQFLSEQGSNESVILVDARAGLNIDDLADHLVSRAKRLPALGMELPSSWLKVRKWFMDNLQELETEGGEGKELIDRSFLDKLFTDCKVHPATEGLLFEYLQFRGFLYWHENLGEHIIAHQQWALRAIYRVLDRKAPHYEVFQKDLKGKVRLRRLQEVLGPTYTAEQKQLFIEFMVSCRLCFRLNEATEQKSWHPSTVFVFPQLLPVEQPAEIVAHWEQDMTDAWVFRYQLEWPNYLAIHPFIARFGQAAGIENIWRTGIDLQTTEGRFRVMLDYPQKKLFVHIHPRAVGKWLPSILEALDYTERQKWEYRQPEKEDFQPLDLEKIRNGEGLDVLALTRTEGVASLDELPKQPPQEPDYESLLFLAANPAKYDNINFRVEKSDVDDVCKNRAVRGQLVLCPANHTTLQSLNVEIELERPHILHFVGHGTQENKDFKTAAGLIFHRAENLREDEKLTPEIAGPLFEKICRKHPQLRIVFLNACFSLPLAKAISAAGLYVIGSSVGIKSVPALRFAEGFYWQYLRTSNPTQKEGIWEAFQFGMRQALTADAEAESYFHLCYSGDVIKLMD